MLLCLIEIQCSIFIFRDQLQFDKKMIHNLWEIILMVTKFYIIGFYTANVPITAPNTDFTLMKKCISVAKISERVSSCFYKKISGQLWYLSPELVCLALFDSDVEIKIKQQMAKKILEKRDEKPRIKKGEYFLSKRFMHFLYSHFSFFILCT